MVKNYFVLFIRNIRRQKLFSAINILGLTLSIASTLLIYLYVRHEFSYDRFHPNAERIYRVNQTFIWGENDNHQFGSTGPNVAFALKEELPEIELISRLHTRGELLVTYTNKNSEVASFEESKIVYADSNFFNMFYFPLVKGDPASALRLAQTIVVTESTARKYFGSEDPIGKQLRIGTADEQGTYEVTGVVKDCPSNTYIKFDMLVSLASLPVINRMSWSWVWTQLETYVRFKENTNMEGTLRRLALVPKKHADATLRGVMNVTYDEYIKSGKKWELFLQPLTGIHLPPDVVYNRISVQGNITIVYSLIGSAIFIILLSCVNFMNLSTAQFLKRMKEASIRKILGIGRKELTMHYFLEAVMFCIIALVAGLALAQLFLPAFNTLAGKNLTIDLLNDRTLLAALISLVVLMGVLSGSYPAIFLGSFSPVEAMKGKLKSGQEGKTFRNGLVIFQFSASIVLIICTAIVLQQLTFISEKDLGFDKENLVVLDNVESAKARETITDGSLSIPGILSATRATSLPPYLWGGDTFTSSGENKRFNMNFTTTDEKFVPTFGLKVKFGRNFSADIPADSARLIVNEETVKKIGWTLDESVIGKIVQYDNSRFEVIGVVNDFNYWPLQSQIQPVGIFHLKAAKIIGDGPKEFIAIRIAPQGPEEWKTTLAELEKLWKAHTPEAPFQYSFVDDNFAQSFKAEEQLGDALTVMAGLAIIIASLGLLGMIVYALELRTKEIGIRKISGASTWNILSLISKSYSTLVIVAFLLGAPIAWWMMDKWLEGFTYRITPSPWLFAVIGLATLGLAAVITSYHSIKAAMTNPVDVLKDE